MVQKNTYQFLISLKGAWKNNKNYFQALRTKEVMLIANLFKILGVILKIDYFNKYIDWFEYAEFKDNAKKQWGRQVLTKKFARVGILLKTFTKNTSPYYEIKSMRNLIIYQRAQPIFISYISLKKYYSSPGSVFILKTDKGIITSKEAIALKRGGYIICKIEF